MLVLDKTREEFSVRSLCDVTLFKCPMIHYIFLGGVGGRDGEGSGLWGAFPVVGIMRAIRR